MKARKILAAAILGAILVQSACMQSICVLAQEQEDNVSGSGEVQSEEILIVEAQPEDVLTGDKLLEEIGRVQKSEEMSEDQKTKYPEYIEIGMDETWEFASFSEIHSGYAKLYYAQENRKGIIVGVNAGHGTQGGTNVKTWCHPDQTPKVTGGTTEAGALQAIAVSTGMEFYDGTAERDANLQEALLLKDLLLQGGYDVLMIRDGEDVQLDNVARTILCNNIADCHIAIHWDGDGLGYDKGCYYMSVPENLKGMYPVTETWEKSHRLGDSLIAGLRQEGRIIFESGAMPADLTQTSYSKVASVDIELGNAASDHSMENLEQIARGLYAGVEIFFNA